jgi:ribosomal protein S6--L-glutamate ligase
MLRSPAAWSAIAGREEGMTARPGRQPSIAFLLGKPIRGTSVLSEVLDRVRALPATATVHLPEEGAPLPTWLSDAELVVQRGLGLPALGTVLPLEQAGVRCCNRIAATIALKDRALTVRALAGAEVPVPATVAAAQWPELLDLTTGRPVVVKVAAERVGRGLGVLVAASGRLPPQAPFPGPFIAQDFVPSDGRDYKLYVAGRHAAGLVKRWPRPTGDELGTPFAVDAELTGIARRVGTALGLEIYGVDVLYGPHGPVVVDVNPFPGFRGVPGAAASIARHLIALATGHDQG